MSMANLGMFVVSTIVTAIALMIVSFLFPSIKISGVVPAIILAIVLNLLNVYLFPIIMSWIPAISSPILQALVRLLINAIILCIAIAVTGSGSINGIGTAMIISVIITILQSLLMTLPIFK